MSILYRDHRGGLDESMATVQEIKSMQQLRAYLKTQYSVPIVDMKIEYACFDPRLNWETYYVMIKLSNMPIFIIAGMSNGKEIPEFHIDKDICLN